MYLFDFQKKLQKLNPLLYVRTNERSRLCRGLFSVGIYLKAPTRKKQTKSGDKALIHGTQQKYLDAIERGDLDTFLMGVCYNYVPEYDVFDMDLERLLMPGWRSILTFLIKKQVIDAEKAKRIFRCKSLGTTDWDKSSFTQKMRWAIRGER
jgi:hypothetical protein